MWQTIQLDGIEADIYEPEQRAAPGALVYLHGHAGERLSTQPEFSRLLAAAGLPVIAPQGGKSWWLDLPSREFPHVLSPMEFVRTLVMQEVQRRWGVEAPLVGLLGVSMGGQGAFNLAYRYGRQFPCVAAISPAIDFHTIYGKGYLIDELFSSPEAARQQTVTLHLHPLNWPKHQFFACDPLDRQWHEGAARLASKLTSSGIPHTADLTTSCGGHNWDYFTHIAQQAIPFLARALHERAHAS